MTYNDISDTLTSDNLGFEQPCAAVLRIEVNQVFCHAYGYPHADGREREEARRHQGQKRKICGVIDEMEARNLTENNQPSTQKNPYSGRQLFDRNEVLYSKRKYWVLRRLQDILLSAIAILVLWPFLLLIAIIIVIDSPGASPIYSQVRVGRDGKEFRFYKFRSMKPDADKSLDQLLEKNEMDGPVFKIKEDPRITRFGRIIRKTAIDELPQLFNILMGDMSIVGPRPALPREVAQYSEYEKQRLFVSPGLTCYWQIQPHRNNMSFDRWLELDLKYIKERSFIVDWKIILGTINAVIKGYGE